MIKVWTLDEDMMNRHYDVAFFASRGRFPKEQVYVGEAGVPNAKPSKDAVQFP